MKKVILFLLYFFVCQPTLAMNGEQSDDSIISLDEIEAYISTPKNPWNAAQYNDVECLKYLEEQGISLTEYNANGRKPIHLAVEAEAYEALKFLHQLDPNPEAPTKHSGSTPLHITARQENTKSLLYLLKHTKNIRVLDKKQKTPKDVASKLKIKTIFTLWEEMQYKNGIKPNYYESGTYEKNNTNFRYQLVSHMTKDKKAILSRVILHDNTLDRRLKKEIELEILFEQMSENIGVNPD